MSATVKFAPGSDTLLHILAIPFSSPFKGGKDWDEEFFSPRTNLCLDLFPDQRPLLYDHGLNAKTGLSVIGRTDSKTLEEREDGYWVQAQINRNSAYRREVQRMIEAEALHASSGALSGYTQKARNGEILRWPWVELSLTPTPANPFAIVKQADVTKHYKAVDLDFELPSNWETGDAAGTHKVGQVISAATGSTLRTVLSSTREAMATLSTALDTLDGLLKQYGKS
jgi:hypothetical protein